MALEYLSSQIFTTENVLTSEILKNLERTLDESGVAEIKRIGPGDPPCKKVEKFEGELRELLLKKANPKETDLYVETNNGKIAPFMCHFHIRTKVPAITRDPHGNPMVYKVDTNYSELGFSLWGGKVEPYKISEFAKLFMDVCRIINAFYGECSDASMFTQFVNFMDDVDEEWRSTKRGHLDQVIWDIYWLNYFGPAYIEFWGKDKLAELAKGYDNAAQFPDGAICIQTTPEPIKADCSVKGIKDYSWKKHFYDVLGDNTFMHETYTRGQVGQYVPTLEMHRKYNRDPVRLR